MTRSYGQCSRTVCVVFFLASGSDFNSIAVVSPCPQRLRTSGRPFTAGEAEVAEAVVPSWVTGYCVNCSTRKHVGQHKNFNEAFEFSTHGNWLSCCRWVCFLSPFQQPTSKKRLMFFPRAPALERAVVHCWPGVIALEISLDTRHSLSLLLPCWLILPVLLGALEVIFFLRGCCSVASLLNRTVDLLSVTLDWPYVLFIELLCESGIVQVA